MNLPIPDNVYIHIGNRLQRISIFSATNDIGLFIQCLYNFGQHQIMHLSYLDPSSTGQKLEQDLPLQLVRTLVAMLDPMRCLRLGWNNICHDHAVIT